MVVEGTKRGNVTFFSYISFEPQLYQSLANRHINYRIPWLVTIHSKHNHYQKLATG